MNLKFVVYFTLNQKDFGQKSQLASSLVPNATTACDITTNNQKLYAFPCQLTCSLYSIVTIMLPITKLSKLKSQDFIETQI